MVDERFLAEIDAIYPKLGFDSRASFVRDAVIKELARRGFNLPAEYKACPSSGGVRGRPRKAAIVAVQGSESGKRKAKTA